MDYTKRLTATEAYNHPFLQIQPAVSCAAVSSSHLSSHNCLSLSQEFTVFSPRRKFKVYTCPILTILFATNALCLQAIIDCVWVCIVLQKLRRTPKTVTLGDITPNPYSNRYIRKMIDSCAFSMYGHWVKRGEEQNRAALFETTPKLAGKTSDLVGGVTIIFN